MNEVDSDLIGKTYEDIEKEKSYFLRINNYAFELSNLSYDDLFPYIAKSIKQLFNVGEVFISLYDEYHSEIETKYSTFSAEENNKISKYLGGKIIGLRSPVNEEAYKILTSNTISVVNSLSEVTFGKIPDTVGKLIENVYGIGWYVGISLMQGKKLIGTIVLVGEKGKEIPDTTILEVFTKITTSELSRKIAEQSLIFSEDRYRSLLTNLETGVVVHDKDTKIIYCNTKSSELLGLSENQMKGKEAIDPYWRFIHEDNSPVPLDEYPVMKIINSKKAIRNQILGVYRSPDDLVWLLVNGFPSFIEGEISEIIISFIDITEVRLANQALLKAKQEVEESEQRFKALHNASFGGITIHDKGLILDCNQGLSEMFGYSHSELIGMNGLLLIAPQDRDFVINKIAIGYEKPYEAMGIRKNGEQFPIRLEARNVPFKGKQVRTVEFRDLTEQKKAEEELIIHSERLRFALSAARQSWFDATIPTGNVFVSPEYSKMLGYEEDEFVSSINNWLANIHPEDLITVKKMLQYVLESGKVGEVEYRRRTKTNEWKWIYTTGAIAEYDDEGKPYRLTGIHMDIDGRKQAEEELQIKNMAIESSINAIAIADLEGTITYVNNAFLNLWGYEDIQNVIGQKTVDFWNNTDDPTVVIESLQNKGYWKGELIGKRNDASEFISEVSASMVKDKNGKPLCMQASFIDITDRKNAEIEIINAKEKAEENEQMFKSLIENAPDGVVIVDINGNIKYGSPNSARHFGYQEEDILGHSGSEFTHPDDIPFVWKTFESIMVDSTLKPKIKYRFKRKNGDYRWIETTFTNQLSNKYIKGFILNFSDITESKKAEEALRASEAKLSALFSSMSEMVVMHELVFDSLGNPINYRITDCNDAFVRITGISKGKAIGKLATEVYKTPYAPYLEEYSIVALNGVPHHYETYFEPMDKHFLISVVSPEQNHFATITSDITDHKRAELLVQDKSEEIAAQNEELNLANLELINAISRAEQNEANVTAIIEGTQHSIWAFDRNYDILYINQVFKNEYYQTFGVKLDIGINLINCLPDLLRPFWKPRYDRVLANEHYTVEDEVETENGTLYIQVTFNPIIKNGEVIGGSCFGSNITERKRAEKELRDSHIRYKELFDSMPNGLYRSTPEGHFIDANPAFINMLGYDSLEELKSLNIPKDVFVEENERNSIIEENAEFIDKVETYRLRKKDGTIIWVEDNARYIKDNENRIIYHEGICKDITERIRSAKEILEAKEKAEESEMQFRNLFENASDAIFIAEEESGVIIDVNHAAEKLMLMDRDELIGIHQSKLHPSEVGDFSKDSFKKHTKKPVDDRTPLFIENDVVRKDGTRVPVEVLANKLMYKGKQCLVGTFRDITERRNTELEIIKAKEKIERHAIELNKVQTITHVGSWYLDIETDDVVWTEELYKMYGFDPKLPPPPYSEHMKLFVPESWEILSTSLARTRETGIPYELELKTVRKDKSNGWMWVRVDALFDKNNNIVGLWGAAQDITERKFIEEQLRVAKEKAEESDRLKSAFLANMSHEIRTPMNGILGFSQLLKEPDLSGDEQLEFISIIEKSGKRMLNIINDIIDISKIEAGLMKLNIQESNINDQIQYIHSFFQPEANYKNIKLLFHTSLPDQSATISTDKEKVFAIFTNLVKNAIKFTDYGTIEFGYNLKVENNSKFLQFYVKDTGIGIPKSRQKAIFERFIQADITDAKAYQGAGLGLAITKAYVEMLGGSIWVESQEGQGSTFYFTLPYMDENNNEAVAIKEINEKDLLIMKKLKILIAEDDKISEKLVEKFIVEFSSEILKVNNGKAAVEVCKNNPDIDLIMMDIQMPEVDGYNATKQIRGFNKDVIIIAQTAYGLVGDRDKALEAGCSDYISKPIDKDELTKLINKYFSTK